MRIPFPRRIPYAPAFLFAVVLSAVLLAQGNPFNICLIILSWIMVAVFGFNLAGGIANPVGAYLFFLVLFTGLLGTVVKALLNEPLLENVPNSDQTLLIYLVGTSGTVAAVALSKLFAAKKPLLEGRLTQENTLRVVVGCIASGILIPMVLGMFLGGGSGSLSGIVRQLNIALPLSVLIAVYQKVKETGGRSSFSWPALFAAMYSTYYFGLLSYSKEGIFAPWMAWLVAAAAAGLRVTFLQVLITIPAAVLSVMLLVPFAQYGRNFRDQTAADPHIAIELLKHPWKTREIAISKQGDRLDMYHWYRKTEGILDRLTLVPIDSALIAHTDRTKPLGLANVGYYFENIIPHFLLPDKPNIRTGNSYAHEIGMLGPNDFVTGISFSPFSEAYHLGGWMGVILVMPCVQFLLFLIMLSVSGDADSGPWALFYIAEFAHLAAEGSLAFPVYILSFGTEALIATTFFMVYVTPVIGSLIVGPGSRTALARPVPLPGVRRRPTAA